jgi:hypothetical protein
MQHVYVIVLSPPSSANKGSSLKRLRGPGVRLPLEHLRRRELDVGNPPLSLRSKHPPSSLYALWIGSRMVLDDVVFNP